MANIPLISLIVRHHRRLEYTIRCLNELALHPGETKFEVVLVDNSEKQALTNWLQEEVLPMPGMAKMFKFVRHIKAPKNLGDWGGMRLGIEHSKGGYIAQLDNDIFLDARALTYAKRLIDAKFADVVMAKRQGVRSEIRAENARTVDVGGPLIQIGDVPGCVAFYVVRRVIAEKHYKTARNARDFTKKCGKCVKMTTIFSTQMEGFGYPNGTSYLQKEKYGKREKG